MRHKTNALESKEKNIIVGELFRIECNKTAESSEEKVKLVSQLVPVKRSLQVHL